MRRAGRRRDEAEQQQRADRLCGLRAGYADDQQEPGAEQSNRHPARHREVSRDELVRIEQMIAAKKRNP